MIEVPSLYPHQIDHVARVRTALTRSPSVILCANPGVGKTRMAKWMIGTAANRPIVDGMSGNGLFCVHRRGLVINASDSFNEKPRLPHGVIMSGAPTDWSKRTYAASIDTILSWYCEGGYNTELTFDLICFDECHSHLSKFRTFLDGHNAKRAERGLRAPFVLGLSATPDAKSQADTFNEIILGQSTEWLIDNGFLSPFRYFRATQGKLGMLVKRGKEFTKESVGVAMDGLSGDLVRDWMQFGQQRPTVGFFTRLSHAKAAQAELIANGIDAEYVDGSTPDDKRKHLFEALERGDYSYLCNCSIVERGTNVPAIGCVQLCTAIGSVARYRQMIGRGSRTAEGKSDCIVIDHGGNVARHGFFEDEVPWVLDRTTDETKEHQAKPKIECPKCQAIYRGGKCRNCDYEPTTFERKAQGLQFNGVELQEVVRKPKADRNMASKTPEQIMVSALYAAGKRGQTFGVAVKIAQAMARSSGVHFKVPRKVRVGRNEYQLPVYGSHDTKRRVNKLFPFIR